MPCHFCKRAKHASENCIKYSTLRSRYSRLKLCYKYCLCENFVNEEDATCKCKTFCDVCLQQHHIAFCPKRDPNHPSFVNVSEKEDIIKLDVPILDRLFVLSDPITKIKLQMTCKSLFNLPKTQYKLCNIFYWKNAKPNTIYNGHAAITRKDDLRDFEETKNIVFNVEHFFIFGRKISKTDLKILSKNYPLKIHIDKCQFDSDLSFFEFLNAFPYCIEFSFSSTKLPDLWIGYLRAAKRYVNIKKVLYICLENYFNFHSNYFYKHFIELYKSNENLKMIFVFDKRKEDFQIFLQKLQQTKSIRSSDEKNCNLVCKLFSPLNNEIKQRYFNFNAATAKATLYDSFNDSFDSLFQSTK